MYIYTYSHKYMNVYKMCTYVHTYTMCDNEALFLHIDNLV